MIVSALQIVAAESDATANEVGENWAPFSIYFSFYNAVDFIRAFAFKYRDSRVAGTVFSEQIELKRHVCATLHPRVHRERLGESHVRHSGGRTMYT